MKSLIEIYKGQDILGVRLSPNPYSTNDKKDSLGMWIFRIVLLVVIIWLTWR